jgi:hypothetical protein
MYVCMYICMYRYVKGEIGCTHELSSAHMVGTGDEPILPILTIDFSSCLIIFYRNRLPDFFHLLWNSNFDKDAWIGMDFIFSLGSFSIYFKILKINFNNNYLKNVNCFCRIVFCASLKCLWKTFIWVAWHTMKLSWKWRVLLGARK